MDKIEYRPIGIIHSPFKTQEGTPIQAVGGIGIDAVAEIFPEYVEGLEDIEGFSHVILLYHFHRSKAFSLKVKPFLDDAFHGLFATRAPSRPNAVGISVVRLLRADQGKLYIRDIDILDGTPLLDIKPYIPEFDVRNTEKTGWFETCTKKARQTQDDGRFSK
jgi:tRNA (adenine37-N6)-methyltransferase